jgi:hypothetical protein
VVTGGVDHQAAPGALETVRSLLNSWVIPNDTRTPRDDLDDWLAEHGLTDRDALARLRGEVRDIVDSSQAAADGLVNGWIDRYDIRPRWSDGRIELHALAEDQSAHLALIVLRAIADGTLTRLKTCPDCRWAFYDRTRNNSKRWCVMTTTNPSGRSCGNLAKARRFRDRRRRSPS